MISEEQLSKFNKILFNLFNKVKTFKISNEERQTIGYSKLGKIGKV